MEEYNVDGFVEIAKMDNISVWWLPVGQVLLCDFASAVASSKIQLLRPSI